MNGYQKDLIRTYGKAIFASIDGKLLGYKIGREKAREVQTMLLEVYRDAAESPAEREATQHTIDTLEAIGLFQVRKSKRED